MLRAAGFLSALATYISFAGRFSWLADLSSHFRFLWASILLPVLLVNCWNSSRNLRWAILLWIAFGLNLSSIAPLYVPTAQQRSVEPPDTTIRLLQFNTWPKNRNHSAVITLIESELPNVIGLQETNRRLRTLLIERFADQYEIKVTGSLMLMVRREPKSIERIELSSYQMTPGGEALAARIATEDQEIAILCFHATAPLGPNKAAQRDRQLQWAAHWARHQIGPVVILGDLNASAWSSHFREFLRSGELEDSAQGFGFQPTWRTRFGPFRGIAILPFQIPIDHCLHSPEIDTLARSIGPPSGSNHYPVLIRLRIPSESR